MSYDPSAKYRFYVLNTWTPAEPGRGYGSHWHYGIVAESVDEAIAVLKEKYPRARVDSVNNQGSVHFVSGEAVI